MLSFKDFLLNEANKGFEYEQHLHKILSAADLVPASFSPAASGHGPDGMFLYKGKKYNYEIKLNFNADFGQLELRYKNGHWEFGENANEESKELYTSLGVLKFVEKSWGKFGAPRREVLSKKEMTPEDAKYDFDSFKDAYMDIPLSVFLSHYMRKNVYYIQIKGSGLYYLGKDIAGLGVPKFDASFKLRIRRKHRSSKSINGYGFVTALKPSKIKKSNFDLEKDPSFLK